MLKPDFDKHQFERSVGKPRPGIRRNEELADKDRDRDFKKPKFDSRNQGGRGGGKKGRVPDFVKNPSGYTKYSLKDVPEVNQRSNSAAAFDFLRQLKEKSEGESEPAADLSQKIVFKKRVKKDLPEDEESVSNQHDSGERSEPTSKNVKSKGTKSTNRKKSSQMTLSHLDGEEDEFQ